MVKLKSKKSSKKSSIKKVNSFEVGDKNYNMIKVKSNYLNLLSVSIIITGLFIFFLGYIVYYLNNLKKCRCFQEENSVNKSNIEYLIIIEAITIAFNVVILINLITKYMTIDKLKSGGYSTNAKIYIYIGILLYLTVYGFFVHHVYKLSQSVNDDCICSQNPIRYLLYLQAIIISIYLLFLIYAAFLL